MSEKDKIDCRVRDEKFKGDVPLCSDKYWKIE